MKIINIQVESTNASDKIKSVVSAPSFEIPSAHSTYLVRFPVGGKSVAENHSEFEALTILSGKARIECDGETVTVNAGDIVVFEPFESHLVTNTGDAPLDLTTTFWNDPDRISQSALPDLAKDAERPVYVVPAYPTPNGDLHYGHLSGPFISADVLRRGVETGGGKAHMFIGTLGHQNHIALTSLNQKISYYGVAEHFTKEIRKTLDAVNIQPDTFIPPVPTQRYKSMLQLLFQELKGRDLVIAKDCEVLETQAGEVRTEAFISGECPHCGAGCSGNDCEKCGRFHDDVQTINPKCSLSGEPLRTRSVKRYYFRTEMVRDQLLGVFARADYNAQVSAYIDWVMSEALEDFPISQVQPEGVDIGEPGFEDQRFFATFEHGARYLYSFAEASGLYDPEQATARDVLNAARRVLEEDNPRAAIFFGNDNAYVRLIMTPALLLAHLEGSWAPTSFHMNHFLLLDHQKFSTSRGHAIWGREMAGMMPSDIVRICAVLEGPALWDKNFSASKAESIYRDEVYGRWATWLAGVQSRVTQYCDSNAPDLGDWTINARLFFAQLQGFADDIDILYDPSTFSVNLIAQKIRDVIAAAENFSATSRPWRGELNDRHMRTTVALELMAARILAQLLLPVAPEIGSKLNLSLGQLHQPNLRVKASQLRQWLPIGTPINGLDEVIPDPATHLHPLTTVQHSTEKL